MEEKKTKPQTDAQAAPLKKSKDEFLDKLGRDSIVSAAKKLSISNILKCFVDLAIIDYSKSLELMPDCAEIYIARARAYSILQEFDKAWQDVHIAESLGLSAPAKLLEELKNASGREE
jgi:hypothetical protein